MRKLIGALLAMSALAPVAAAAQEGRRGGPRAERQLNENGRYERARQMAEDGEAAPQRPSFTDNRDDGRREERRRAARADVDVQAPRPDRPAFVADGRPDAQDFRADRREDRRDFRRERRQDRVDLPAGRVTSDQFRDDRRDARQDFRRERRDDRQDLRRDRRDWGGDARRDWNRGTGWPDSSFGRNDWDRFSFNGWNRGWRQDRRYDWTGYRGQNRAAYRLPRYYAPYGWDGGYRRFQVGFSLTSALWARNYWIADPWAYRLPPAYGPYRWVRYYDDALLIDLRSGRVVDAVYDIFW